MKLTKNPMSVLDYFFLAGFLAGAFFFGAAFFTAFFATTFFFAVAISFLLSLGLMVPVSTSSDCLFYNSTCMRSKMPFFIYLAFYVL